MHHLAQFNFAKLRYPIDHPNTAEFTDNLDRINQLADYSPGFVWRLKDESGNSTGIHLFDDPLMIINMSVWKDVDSLKQFTYRTEHVQFMRKRRQWFERPTGVYLVMWWISVGHVPTVAEAKERLRQLQEQGESADAFTFRQVFPPPLPA